MPVKVRCPDCEKVLTLPDKARGKTAKCSNCEARIPVPGGTSQPGSARRKKASKKKSRKPAGGEGDDLFAHLDLSRTEDRRVRVCPKCGLQVDEEDIECPKCGVVIATGRLSAERLRKKARGGPDTDKYYENFLTGGWEFLKEHWKFAVRTMIYLLITNLVAALGLFMTLYCSRMPLKVFWCGITLLFALIGPGWCWFLATTLINSAIDKKVKLDRVNFDFFLCGSLGIKFYSWLIVFCFPFQIVTGTIGGLMIANDLLVGGVVIVVIGFLPAFFCFPIALSHMAMPIQWPGWLSIRIVPTFFKGLAGPSMYWCMFCAATMLPSLIFAAIAAFAFQEDVTTLVEDLNYNARAGYFSVVTGVKEISFESRSGNRLELSKEMKEKFIKDGMGELDWDTDEDPTEYAGLGWWLSANNNQIILEANHVLSIKEDERYREIDTESAIPPLVLWFLAIPPFAFAAVFNMRTIGMFTYYYRPELELIMEEKQVTWDGGRRGDDEFDEDGRELESSNIGKFLAGLGILFLVYVIANVITYYTMDTLLMPEPVARTLGLVE